MTEPRRPRPDLAEVLSRARAMNPDAVDPSWGEHPESSAEALVEDGSAEVLDFSQELGPMDPQLEAFVASARTHLDAQVVARRLVDIPPAPAPSRRWALVALGAAAALVLAGSTAWWVSRASTQQAQAVANEAAYVATGQKGPLQGARVGQEQTKAPQMVATAQDASPDSKRNAPAQVAASVDDKPASDSPSRATPPSPKPRKAQRKAAAKKATAPSIDELDAQAQAAWQRGDLKAAAALFEGIIKRAPNSRRAELAYADLFSLAGQRGDQRGLSTLWKAYLKRFPQGRYADDTRARLCRRAARGAQAKCWAEYLHKHPQGAHVREARAADDGAATPVP